jgi:hypothetical protein
MPFLLQRPVVSDVQFDYKSGRTRQGWPLEQIKAGGLRGLVAYACFYACRELRPHLMGDDQNRIGLDPDFCAVFWTELGGFASMPEVTSAMRAYVVACRGTGDEAGPLTVADGLAYALNPRWRALLWAKPAAQLQLLVHGGALAAELRALFTARDPPHRDELDALATLEARLAEAGRAVDAAAAAAAHSVCATNRVLRRVLGEDVRSRSGTLLTLPEYPSYDGELPLGAGGLWDAPLPLLAAQWTHIESRLFRAIPPREVIAAGWDRPRYEHAADAARVLIDRFNACALWVTAEVLICPSPLERAAVIARWIQLACSLRRLRNYSGVFQVSVGLRRDCVARLGASWALLPPVAKEKWAEIAALTGEEGGRDARSGSVRFLMTR